VHGGQVVAQGTPAEIIANPASLTGAYLSGGGRSRCRRARRGQRPARAARSCGARGNNLRNVDLAIPVGLLTCITGVSGSGKSTLINDTLYPPPRATQRRRPEPAPPREIDGLELFDKVIDIDQSPIGRTPRSNPATYTGLFTPIRELFAGVPEARARATGRGASASTSRAAAARPARATA
jgi:excinuclease ABC subunit A